MKTKLTRFLSRSFAIDFTEAIQQGIGEFAIPYTSNTKKCSSPIIKDNSKNVFAFNGTGCIRNIEKPKVDEYPPYSSIYMDLLEDDSRILGHLRKNLDSLRGQI